MNTPSHSDSLFNKQIQPIRQAIVAVGALVIIMPLSMVFIGDGNTIYYWEIAFAILMCFSLFNAIFSIPFLKRTLYFRNSIFCYVGVATISGLLAFWFSGISLEQSGSFKWLYIVFTFSYLLIISIVNAMRKIIEIAKKQDARLAGQAPIDPRLN